MMKNCLIKSDGHEVKDWKCILLALEWINKLWIYEYDTSWYSEESRPQNDFSSVQVIFALISGSATLFFLSARFIVANVSAREASSKKSNHQSLDRSTTTRETINKEREIFNQNNWFSATRVDRVSLRPQILIFGRLFAYHKFGVFVLQTEIHLRCRGREIYENRIGSFFALRIVCHRKTNLDSELFRHCYPKQQKLNKQR